MKSSLDHSLPLPNGIPAADARSLHGTAQGLKRAAEQGTPQALLRGKHVAVFSEDPQSGPALAFDKAASALGARVSHLLPRHELLHADGADIAVLARLYDAIGWEGLSPEAARRLQEKAGIPVFNGSLLHGMAPPCSEDDLAYLAQAMLVNSIG